MQLPVYYTSLQFEKNEIGYSSTCDCQHIKAWRMDSSIHPSTTIITAQAQLRKLKSLTIILKLIWFVTKELASHLMCLYVLLEGSIVLIHTTRRQHFFPSVFMPIHYIILQSAQNMTTYLCVDYFWNPCIIKRNRLI